MIGMSLGAVTDGLGATVVAVEADVTNGLPQFHIVGLPDSAVNESKLRIRAAMKNAGMEFPNRRITVNLSPAGLRKRGSGLDLAIAVAILRSIGTVPREPSQQIGFCAELSLSGDLRTAEGAVALGLALRARGVFGAAVGKRDSGQCYRIPHFRWYAFSSLQEVVTALQDARWPAPLAPSPPQPPQADANPDLCDVVGMQEEKRVLAAAAVGRHHTLLAGPPGCGKTMLAERLVSLLPDLGEEEALEVFAIHQSAGSGWTLSRRPPLRMPHHSLTPAGMTGGGSFPSPGEVTLAHQGVLLLDEVLEFQRATLDSLREPMTERAIRLSRGGRSMTMPADFLFIGTLNPCPCGWFGHGECRCHPSQIRRYWSRLSGPLLDRLELFVQVHRHDAQHGLTRGPSSAVLREQVAIWRAALGERTHARAPQQQRPPDAVPEAWDALVRFVLFKGLSRRAQISLLRVARTLSVIDGADHIALRHVEEACALRPSSPSQP